MLFLGSYLDPTGFPSYKSSLVVRKHTFLYVHPTKTKITPHTRCLIRVLIIRRIGKLWLSKMRPVKIPIRLRECAGWSESSLGAFVQRYVFCRLIRCVVPKYGYIIKYHPVYWLIKESHLNYKSNQVLCLYEPNNSVTNFYKIFIRHSFPVTWTSSHVTRVHILRNSLLNAKHSGYNFQQTTYLKYFLLLLLFFLENRFWHFMQIVDTNYMKFQILFSGKNKKNIISLSFAELVQILVKANLFWW